MKIFVHLGALLQQHMIVFFALQTCDWNEGKDIIQRKEKGVIEKRKHFKENDCERGKEGRKRGQ